MQLNGVLQIDVPPARVLEAMDRPEVLRGLLPGETEVKETGPGTFDFTLRKAIGFLELRQSGTIRVERTAEGAMMTLHAAHRIGGSADVVLKAGLTAVGPRRTRIDYEATLTGSGLAGRLLRDREARVQPYITQVFQRLRNRIETTAASET